MVSESQESGATYVGVCYSQSIVKLIWNLLTGESGARDSTGMVWCRPLFLTVCWPEALVSSYLHISTQNMEAFFLPE